jgi:hypothetical protein
VASAGAATAVLVAELLPSAQRIVFRGVDDEWRLVKFADGDDVSIPPETTRQVELEVVSEYLGEGETKTCYRYQWAEDGRSILAEEVKNEVYDGATPYSTYVRGVIIDCAGGVLLTGKDDSARIIEG